MVVMEGIVMAEVVVDAVVVAVVVVVVVVVIVRGRTIELLTNYCYLKWWE